MSLLHLAFAVVAGVVIAVFAFLYWHESRRPETRPGRDPAGWPGPPVGEVDPDRRGP